MNSTLNSSPQNQDPKYPEGYMNWPMDKKEAFLKDVDTMVDGVRLAAESWEMFNPEVIDGKRVIEPLTPENYIRKTINETALTPENIAKVTMALDTLVGQGVATENNGVYEVAKKSRITKVANPDVPEAPPKAETNIESALDMRGNTIEVGSAVKWGSNRGEIISLSESSFGTVAIIKPFDDPMGEFKVLAEVLEEMDPSENPKNFPPPAQPVVSHVISPEPPPMMPEDTTEHLTPEQIKAAMASYDQAVNSPTPPPFPTPEPPPMPLPEIPTAIPRMQEIAPISPPIMPPEAPAAIPRMPEVTPAPPPIVQPENTPTSEWEEFEKLRNELAKTEALKLDFSSETGTSIEDLRKKYQAKREDFGEKIKKDLRDISTVPQTLEEEAELNKRINDALFEELVKKENDAYLNALRENRKTGILDKAKEGAKNLLGTKAAQWYLGLSRTQKMMVSFTIGSIAGLAVGSTIAPGAMGAATYIAWRAAKTTLSGLAGAGVKHGLDKVLISDEDSRREEAEEIEALKNSNLSVAEKSKGLVDIEKSYKRRRMSIGAAKMVATAVAGAGAGMLTNMAEGLMMGHGSSSSVLESKGKKAPIVPTDNKLPPRQGFDPSKTVPSAKLSEHILKPSQLESAPTTAPTTTLVEKLPIFAKEDLKYEAEAGDSVWGLLRETLDKSDEFDKLTEAQKTYVLSDLMKKVLENPESYGVRQGGGIQIGDKVNLEELFKDSKGVDDLFDDAKKTVGVGSAQEKSILLNNQKIATWLEKHPDEYLSEDKVPEIVNTKPEVEVLPKAVELDPLPKLKEALEKLDPKDIKVPEAFSERFNEVMSLRSGLKEKILALEAVNKNAPDFNSAEYNKEFLSIRQQMDKYENEMRELVEEMKKPNMPNIEPPLAHEAPALESVVQAEIADARAKFITEDSTTVDANKNIRTMAGDMVNQAPINKSFEDTVNHIYGNDGWLGIGKVVGVQSKEWGEIVRLPAKEVLEYFEHPDAPNNLPKNILASLQTSEKHRKLVEEVSHLVSDVKQYSNIDLKPYENENMEAFIKRGVTYLLKHTNQTQNG